MPNILVPPKDYEYPARERLTAIDKRMQKIGKNASKQDVVRLLYERLDPQFSSSSYPKRSVENLPNSEGGYVADENRILVKRGASKDIEGAVAAHEVQHAHEAYKLQKLGGQRSDIEQVPGHFAYTREHTSAMEMYLTELESDIALMKVSKRIPEGVDVDLGEYKTWADERAILPRSTRAVGQAQDLDPQNKMPLRQDIPYIGP